MVLYCFRKQCCEVKRFCYDKYSPACSIQNFMIPFTFYGFIYMYCPWKRLTQLPTLEFQLLKILLGFPHSPKSLTKLNQLCQ